MNEQTLDAAAEVSSTESEDFAAERSEQVERFVKTSPGYYRDQFARIGISVSSCIKRTRLDDLYRRVLWQRFIVAR